MVRFVICCILILLVSPATAKTIDDAHIFDIDLQEETPVLSKLQKEYHEKKSQYSWHYQFRWNMPSQFDTGFQNIINEFGNTEKRLDNANEERILQMLQRLPKEMYPYIGPLLHTVRGLSGKVLDLPGIKETKNQFPKRIARDLQDIEYLEFASPSMYIFLMPEIWGEKSSVEYPKLKNKSLQIPHKIRINPEFIATVEKNVPAEKFMLNRQSEEAEFSPRNYNADKNTPLSKADVKAFIGTFDGLNKFLHQNQNEMRLMFLEPLIKFYDRQNGEKPIVSYFKAAVNPCQTVVRKVKWLGKYDEFQKVIGEQGFGLDDWAYTCDKTIKAYRVFHAPITMSSMVNIVRKGLYDKMLLSYNLTPQDREMLHYQAQAFLQLYTASKNDIDAVRPFAGQLGKKLIKLGNQYGGTPFIMPY
jgi:hypothetical protein